MVAAGAWLATIKWSGSHVLALFVVLAAFSVFSSLQSLWNYAALMPQPSASLARRLIRAAVLPVATVFTDHTQRRTRADPALPWHARRPCGSPSTRPLPAGDGLKLFIRTPALRWRVFFLAFESAFENAVVGLVVVQFSIKASLPADPSQLTD